MNLSELFIRRPVMTVLLNLAIVLAGVIGYRSIPVAALPSYDTPVINVSASLPGASPETMASSVALPLEKQFQTIPGLKTISSTSTLGNTSLTLEFEEGRNIDAAAVDVQAALLRAQRALPQDMTSTAVLPQGQPGRCAGAADRADLALAGPVGSAGLCRAPDLAHAVHHRRRGAGQHLRLQTLRGARAVQPEALAARNIGLDELSAALRAANVNTPVGTWKGPADLDAAGQPQLRNAAEFAELIVSQRQWQPVRLKDVATVEDSVETVKSWAT
jgi:HAE1 family hydrophobic/amphiphilic exporter-1